MYEANTLEGRQMNSRYQWAWACCFCFCVGLALLIWAKYMDKFLSFKSQRKNKHPEPENLAIGSFQLPPLYLARVNQSVHA